MVPCDPSVRPGTDDDVLGTDVGFGVCTVLGAVDCGVGKPGDGGSGPGTVGDGTEPVVPGVDGEGVGLGVALRWLVPVPVVPVAPVAPVEPVPEEAPPPDVCATAAEPARDSTNAATVSIRSDLTVMGCFP